MAHNATYDGFPVPDNAIEAASKLLDLESQRPPVNVLELLKRFSIRLEEQPLEDNVSGMLLVQGDRAIVGVNRNHHINRKRFTIAHELGHFLLHRHQNALFVDAFVLRRDEVSGRGEDPQEIEANAFAAELLMPKVWLQREIEHGKIDVLDEDAIWRLSGRFGVSTLAMTIRLTRLGFIA